MKRNKVVAILPAYNADKTLKKVLQSLPKGVFDDVIVSDDHSVDFTFDLASKIKGITCVQTPRNLGYGGNVKFCLGVALAKKADIIVEIHPDGEYEVDGILPAITDVENGAQLVLGNRFAGRIVGMYKWKLLGTKLLSRIDNLLLGTRIPDLHQGFRVYTRELLEAVPYLHTHNDYLFSFEIIVQAVRRGCSITSVPVSTYYSGNKRGARTGATILYAMYTFYVLILFWLSRMGFRNDLFDVVSDKKHPLCPTCRNSYLVRRALQRGKWSVYMCDGCETGFCYPKPTDMRPWYDQSYYETENVVGRIKKFVYSLFQNRRTRWVNAHISKGVVVDVGAGAGEFGKNLGKKYTVIDIETSFATVSSPETVKVDFLKWSSEMPVDAVVFWESLEHVPDPAAYVAHAASMLKQGGYLFIEYPRVNSLESWLFGSRWYHRDLPRHLSQLSDQGITFLAKKAGLSIIYRKPVWAPEYASVGLASSSLGLTADDLVSRSPLFFVLFLPILICSFVVESILFLLGESPIGLVIAKKP